MPISLYFLYLKSIKSIKNVCARIFDVYKSSFLTIYGGLCRPNRAAFLPPQSPQWGDAPSQVFTDYRQAEIFRVDSGAIPLVGFSDCHRASQNFVPVESVWVNRATG